MGAWILPDTRKFVQVLALGWGGSGEQETVFHKIFFSTRILNDKTHVFRVQIYATIKAWETKIFKSSSVDSAPGCLATANILLWAMPTQLRLQRFPGIKPTQI